MSAAPVLIIQLQRLGDIILTFPLFAGLGASFPHSQVWMVAEPVFYEGLAPLLPGVRFFPPGSLPALAKTEFSAVINFSSRQDAAQFNAGAHTRARYGSFMAAGEMHVAGFWQLYRMALTHNNRHNAFHWSDLNRLDLLPALGAERAAKAAGTKRVGLFIGASELAKRPSASFWVGLSRRMAAAGFKPILLGGPSEKDMGAQVAARADLARANFCGKTSLPQLTGLLSTLDLLITPDTGPMHLADWLGRPVLNLSLGNVHAAETGPSASGQWVLRAAMSCIGCWQCARDRLYCHLPFTAKAVAGVAQAILSGNLPQTPPGLELLRTYRDKHGLLRLKSQTVKQGCRPMLEDFWQAAFLGFHNPGSHVGLDEAAARLSGSYPALVKSMAANFGKMIAYMAAARRKGQPLQDGFWRGQPLHSRLLAGYAQMFLQNCGYSRDGFGEMLARLATLGEVFARFA